MAALTFFGVTGSYFAALKDSVYDVDTDPELAPMSGSVTFTPLIDSGDSIPAVTLTPPSNLFLVPIKATIRSGVITSNGATGVKLVANTAVLGLTGNLYYQVDFGAGLTAGGKTYSVRTFTFQAPTTATTVDLVEVTPAVGQPATGPVPSSAVLSVAGRTGNIVITAADISGVENTTNKNAANGYAGLDGSGHLSTAQLPISAMEYKGNWNASTNSPTLADGTGSAGDVYKVATGAARNLGSGSITWDAGDYVIYNGTVWEKSDTTDAVASVAGLIGAVSSSGLRTALGLSFNVKDYGAVGDGVTNDTAAITAAKVAAQAANKPLYFPAGTYLTSDIVDTSSIDWVGDGLAVTTVKARAGSTKLLDVSNGSAGKRMSGFTLDAAGISNTCLDSSWPTTGPSLRHDFRNIRMRGYLTIGWIGDNNNDADFNNVTVENNSDTPDTATAARFHAPGGALALNNCVFALPIKVSAQNITIRDGYNCGIVFDAAGVNALSIHTGYLYPNPVTHNNFDINTGISVSGVAVLGTHVENANNDGYIFGGAGQLNSANAVGGHWFGVSGTTPSPKVAANTLSPSGAFGVVSLDGVFVENLNLADATKVRVFTRNVDYAGLYQSKAGYVNSDGGIELTIDSTGIGYQRSGGPSTKPLSHNEVDVSAAGTTITGLPRTGIMVAKDDTAGDGCTLVVAYCRQGAGAGTATALHSAASGAGVTLALTIDSGAAQDQYTTSATLTLSSGSNKIVAYTIIGF